MVLAVRIPVTLESVLGYTAKGVRSDRLAVCFPSGVLFLLLGKGGIENVADRQLQGIYPADPKRLAAYLGAGVSVVTTATGWALGIVVRGTEVARVSVQKRAVFGAIEITCKSILPVLPLGINLERKLQDIG